jgi:hypothetical protein
MTMADEERIEEAVKRAVLCEREVLTSPVASAAESIGVLGQA